MRRRFIVPGLLVLAISAATALLSWANAQQTDTPAVRESVAVFMRPKLDHAQKLLEALALERFDAIAAEAQRLSLLSREAEWQVLQTADYLHFSGEFRRSADAIRDAAQKKNLDAATLGYVTMTIQCVECHKYVRNVRTAGSQPKSEKVR